MDDNTGKNLTDAVENTDAEWQEEDIERLKALVVKDPERAARELKKVRAEAGANRKAAQELKKLNDAAEAEVRRKAAEQEELAKAQGDWKALAERRETELANLRAEHDKAMSGLKERETEAERLKRFEEAALNRLKARTEAMSEAQRKRLPPLEDPLVLLTWIEENADILQERRASPNLNPGTTGGGKDAKKEAATEVAKQNAAAKVRALF